MKTETQWDFEKATMNITYPEFMAYLRQEAGSTVSTIGQKSRFRLEVLADSLRFTIPNGRKRNESLPWVEFFCELFNKRQSFNTSDYPEEANSSYMLALAR